MLCRFLANQVNGYGRRVRHREIQRPDHLFKGGFEVLHVTHYLNMFYIQVLRNGTGIVNFGIALYAKCHGKGFDTGIDLRRKGGDYRRVNTA